MPATTAHFKQANQSVLSSRIDDDNGIIYGVKVAELGKQACFEGADGKPRTTTVNGRFVDALLSHAAARSIPVHWTHDYCGKPEDALWTKVGALKDFRKDDDGCPIADLHLSPGEYRDKALWNAHNDPTGMMLSPVFPYDPTDPDSIPLGLDAADLVANGAATTALFKQATTNQNQNKMEITELLEMLKDPAVKTALESILKSHEGDGKAEDAKEEEKKKTDAEMEDAAGEMEDAAGVTEEDKKDETEEQKKQPALMRAVRRIAKANARLRKLDQESILIAAEARFTKAIGSNKIQQNLTTDQKTVTATAKWQAKVEEMKAAHGTNAASFAARAFPAEHRAFMKESGAIK